MSRTVQPYYQHPIKILFNCCTIFRLWTLLKSYTYCYMRTTLRFCWENKANISQNKHHIVACGLSSDTVYYLKAYIST